MSEGCCSGSSCCGGNTDVPNEVQVVRVDFLYLDNDTCEPCREAESSLDEAVLDVSKVLGSTGVEVLVNKINVKNEKQAIGLKFMSSPTIRVNGRDIQLDVREEYCKTCSDIAGEDITCRVWLWHGNQYSSPPKGMIVEALLKAVYGSANMGRAEIEPYTIPENLKRFFVGKDGK